MTSAETRPRRRWFAQALIAIAAQVLVALLAIAIKPKAGSEDLFLYYRYATMALDGKVPYRDYSVEYPLLALPLLMLPRVVSPGFVGFRVAFAVEMLLFNAAAVLLIAALVERREGPGQVWSRLAWYTVFFAILSRLVVTRYDAAPMFLSFAASAAWFSGRAVIGGLAAALGTLVKVFPAVVPLVAATQNLTEPGTARGRGTIAFLLALALGITTWLALCGASGVARFLGFHADRGLEYGSLYSGAQMLAATAVGAGITITRDHGAFSSMTPWSARLLRLATPIQLATLLAIAAIAHRAARAEGVRYASAAVLGFIITGKVFSPQYLIWMMPFIASLEGPIARRACRLFAVGCAATLLAQAGLGALPRTSPWIIVAYNLKNLIFLGLLWMMVFGRWATVPNGRRSVSKAGHWRRVCANGSVSGERSAWGNSVG
jgi:hypothetical protein